LAGVRVARDEAGAAGIIPYLLHPQFLSPTDRTMSDTQIIYIPVQSDTSVLMLLSVNFVRCPGRRPVAASMYSTSVEGDLKRKYGVDVFHGHVIDLR
jgi:hypothetical protein